jgi:hypothetical protein
VKLEDLSQERRLLLKCIVGSKAYGLDLPESDTDIKGVFVLPMDRFYGLDYVKQVNNESNDIVFYELRRFFELLCVNNPGMLELLAMPEECILYKHPLFDRVKPELFLSKLCCKTFAGYAFSQIKRAKGLNKKIMNPLPEERMSVLDFCYVAKGQGSIPLREWLAAGNMKQGYCGLAGITHMKGVYGIYYDSLSASAGEPSSLGFRGIARKDNANNVSLSSIPKGLEPLGIMAFNKEAYSKYCRDYKEYWDWVKRRNEVRYRNTIAHGKNYDAKNMMHTFRLLDMAAEIAEYGKVTVKRPNRKELLEIRKGIFLYDDLVARAEARVQEIEALYEASTLPDEPDRTRTENLLVEIRKEFYGSSGTGESS